MRVIDFPKIYNALLIDDSRIRSTDDATMMIRHLAATWEVRS